MKSMIRQYGLITLFNYNYGSALQCYATKEFLKTKGATSDLLTLRNERGTLVSIALRMQQLLGLCFHNPQHVSSILKVFLASRSTNLTLSQQSVSDIQSFVLNQIKPCSCTYKDLTEKSIQKYDAFFSGSDQVWNSFRVEDYESFFLRFAPKEKRIAWAPSFGSQSIAEWNKKRYKEYISEFRILSAREESGAKLIKELTGRDAIVLPDPVTLLNADEWRSQYKGFNLNTVSNEYVLLFFIDRPSNKALEAVRRINGKKILSFGYHYQEYDCLGNYCHVDGDPFEFIHYIDKADMVVTDSYHACVFSIIMGTAFYAYKRNYQHAQDQSGRITELLEQTGLSNRFEADSIDMNQIYDYEKAYQFFEDGKKKASQYLAMVMEQVNE